MRHGHSLLPARLPDGKWFTIRTAIVYYPHGNGLLSGALAVGLAPVLEDNVGTEPHSTFCLYRMDDGIQHSAFVEWTKKLKLPEEFIVEDQNGCDVTLRSFTQLQRMHAWLELKLPEEFITEDAFNILPLSNGRK
ncbi:hypothetical protein HELRODRAFT_165787 [Helobdella robusta]|uniref:Uncharacterized protein n=1 Tax=Helobdella robusta TaxID=6412 RepID=T1EXA2_HELRO|nr:hypothetical protein HELRODRAFT_165787 [Helobdella robusta]ESN91720.1 hypothetical protein HELRODRAFT_165787 [Helobdella robusta]